MTEHSKIDSKSKGAASLFERADKAFGLDAIGAVGVPANLPRPKRRVPQAQPAAPAKAKPEAQSIKPAAEKDVAAPVEVHEPAVALCGPLLETDGERIQAEGLIVPGQPATGLLEEFRIVKRELLADARASSDPKARRILVCSPLPGEGKTYCATNLAIALAAERDIEVVLVDADFLKPSVTRRLGIEGADKGLMDALNDSSIAPETLVSPTDIEGLFVLPAGNASARDSELLTSARTGEVLDRITRRAPRRFVIFDTPPALAASPAAELASHVGQALLVVRADYTGRAALEDARQLLSACPDIKLLLNAAQFSPSGRRFGEYGEREE
ncbi:AAA family ATPase [Qipengyuania nanhaisediminis]|uniref:AAA family ATPase n=1 Tax=Qipengyuania nanhaisediminis TaxID=604088 RepID=UPI0038B34D4D